MASKPLILVIDDNQADTGLIRIALDRMERRTDLCVYHSVKEAMLFLEGLKSDPDAQWPQLLLLDLRMPAEDGLYVLKGLKSDDTLRTIPVVVLTSSDYMGDVQACYDHYANAYVVKPGNLDEYVSMMQQVCQYWLDTVRLPY